MAETRQVTIYQNGLQESDGVVTPVYGSGANQVAQGNDNRFSTAQQLVVKKNPGAGEFSSIKAAVDSVLDASSVKPYTIKVGPGIYIENTIQLKAHVYLYGHGATIVASNPANDVILGAPAAKISGLILTGATDTGACALRFSSDGSGFEAMEASDITFIDNDIYVSVESSAAGPTVLLIKECLAGGVFTDGYRVLSTAGQIAELIVNSSAIGKDIAPYPDHVYFASGPGASLTITNSLHRLGAGNTTHGIHAEDGCVLRISGGIFVGFDRAIHVPNSGAPPELHINFTQVENSLTYDVNVEHLSASGAVTGSFDRTKVSVVPSAPVTLFLKDPVNGGVVFKGNLYLGPDTDNLTEISALITEGSPMGVIEGGALTDAGGLDVEISAGYGYLSEPDPSSVIHKYAWPLTTHTLPANSAVYIYINTAGLLSHAATLPNTEENIILGRVITNATAIDAIDESPVTAHHPTNSANLFKRRALGPVFVSGCIATENGVRGLNVSAGEYFYSHVQFTPSAGTAISMQSYRKNGSGGFTPGTLSTVPNDVWDDGTGTLAALTASYYTKHSLYLVGDGANKKYLFVYGQMQYANLTTAEQSNIPTPPTWFTDGVVLISSIIVQQGVANIVQIRDERPLIGFKASGVSASSTHGNLLGLDADDHLQYLRTDGGRAMSGGLNMGGNAITNVGNVDGVDISAHGSRHSPNGVDPLPTGVPVTVSTANSAGIADSYAKSDHVHAHGNLGGGSTHAAATQSVNGYMSAADKTKLDGISGTRIFKAGIITAATFVGNPKKATVTFSTAFPNTNYCVSVIGADGRMWTFESLTVAGFTINANANAALTGDVHWTAISTGETVE